MIKTTKQYKVAVCLSIEHSFFGFLFPHLHTQYTELVTEGTNRENAMATIACEMELYKRFVGEPNLDIEVFAAWELE